jgi:CRP-like cAMP-binding protein
MKEYRLQSSPGEVPGPVANIPFFAGIAPDTLKEIVKHTNILDCDPGDHLVEEGSADQSLLFLLKGKVRVEKEDTIIAATSATGELLGEIALLKDGTRSATLVAETHVYSLKVDQHFLDNLSDTDRNAYYAGLYRFLAELLAKRLEATSQKLARAEQLLAQKD